MITKFRKGACENCGSMTHKRKDCLERPRKIGARFTGQGFGNDEYIGEQYSNIYMVSIWVCCKKGTKIKTTKMRN